MAMTSQRRGKEQQTSRNVLTSLHQLLEDFSGPGTRTPRDAMSKVQTLGNMQLVMQSLEMQNVEVHKHIPNKHKNILASFNFWINKPSIKNTNCELDTKNWFYANPQRQELQEINQHILEIVNILQDFLLSPAVFLPVCISISTLLSLCYLATNYRRLTTLAYTSL